jgi:putative transposase
MPRIARVVVAAVPHHVTQRGNNRQAVFFTDDDRLRYLELLAEQSKRHGLAIRGYCLMTNHVHLVVVPDETSSLAKALAAVHLRYTQYINRLHGRSGHLWQNRFYSCPLEGEHELTAVRYAERNPVRARLVRLPWRYPWSSAAANCGEADDETGVLQPNVWRRRFPFAQWRRILQQPEDEVMVLRIRRSTFNGRPLGSDRFIAKLESRLNRRLRTPKIGRPKGKAARRKRKS